LKSQKTTKLTKHYLYVGKSVPLTIFESSRLSIEWLLHHHPPRKMVRKRANLMLKGGKLTAKVCTAHSNFIFLHTKKILFILQKIAFLLQK